MSDRKINDGSTKTNPEPQWKWKLDQYMLGKLVDPTNPNFKRWVKRDENYISSHTAAAVQTLQNQFGSLRGLRIIDVGCGGGLDSINLARAGAVVTGIDIVPELIEIARIRAQEEGVHARFLAVDPRDEWHRPEQFDAAIAIDVLEHVEDPINLIKDCWSLLRPDGIAIFSTPNHWALSNVISDPHWHLFGVTLLPRYIAKIYVTRIRRILREYDVTKFIGLSRLRAMMLEQGFVLLYDNVIDAQEKLAVPSNINGNLKRLLAKATFSLAKIKRLRTLMSWLYCFAFTRTWQIVVKKSESRD